MKKLFLIPAVILFAACSSSDDETNEFNAIHATAIEVSLFNTENEDLLDPENPNHWDTSKFKLFYVIDGKKQEVNYGPLMDYPKGYHVFKHANEYRVSISLNESEMEDRSITYIQWNDKDIDTIESSLERLRTGVRLKVVSLNGKQVWKLKSDTAPYFVLTK